MGYLFITVGAVLVLSALCSGTEAAFFSAPMIKIRELAQAKHYAATVFLRLRKKMSRLITSIVILNNLANIGGSMLVGSIAATVLGNRWLGAVSALFTFCVILFSEIIPKTIGERYALRITLASAIPASMLVSLFFPVVWMIEQILKPFLKEEHRYTTNESEIKTLIHIGQKEGVIEDDESYMIHQVFKLNDLRASDIMTPRVMMTSLKKNQSLENAREAIINSEHSRIVVINDTPDEIAGVVMKTEILQALMEGCGDKPLSLYLHKPLFVPETQRADSLLAFFRENKQHLAVVIDEYGGVAGVVSLEDVLEVLTGEIVDETDKSVDLQETARKKLPYMES